MNYYVIEIINYTTGATGKTIFGNIIHRSESGTVRAEAFFTNSENIKENNSGRKDIEELWLNPMNKKSAESYKRNLISRVNNVYAANISSREYEILEVSDQLTYNEFKNIIKEF